jgi:hypothetical protein
MNRIATWPATDRQNPCSSQIDVWRQLLFPVNDNHNYR